MMWAKELQFLEENTKNQKGWSFIREEIDDIWALTDLPKINGGT